MTSQSSSTHAPKNAHNLRIGVIGDGQLAQMMAEAATELGLNFSVFASSAQSPAANTKAQITLGDLNKPSDFIAFCQKNDLITIESEFIDPELLQKSPVPVWPSPSILKSLRDRLPQKESLIEHQIPTSPLRLFKNLKDEAMDFWQTHIEQNRTAKGLVFKRRLFGYDGYGTRILKSLDDLKTFIAETEDLAQHPTTDDNTSIPSMNLSQDWIAEDLVSFTKEFAISFARNPKGQILEFPLVESFQQDSKCLWVKGPIDKTPYLETIQRLKDYINNINFIGLISFELFLSSNGDLVVNEIAPRVHNSAHYSIEALEISQFKAHLMAICDFDLPESSAFKHQKAFAMYNLIGQKDMATKDLNFPELSPDIHLHWYHKTQSRKGRKMGHITTLADTPEKALLKLENIRKDFKL